ncbi:MAG: FkbM family methyltransferase [Phycisphaerales bacterium]|nr:FkbM family methyltransferase [Phycisphaerales bacterium]
MPAGDPPSSQPRGPTRDPLVRLAAAWCRADLPGRSLVARRLARVGDDAFRSGASPVDIRDRWGHHTLRLDPREYFQRWAWLLGRYHEVPLLTLLERALRPGDTFVDIGANFGLVSLRASTLVGPTGRVLAFEPNPVVYERLAWHIDRNGATNITPSRVALARRPGTATLRLASENPGAGSLADLPWARGRGEQFECVVDRGDARLAHLPDAPMLIKIDVEGFEREVLAGLSRTIRQRSPAIISEINRPCLKAAGARPRDLWRMLSRHGYRAFLFEAPRRALGGRRPRLVPFDRPAGPLYDLLFLPPESAIAERLRRFIAGATGDAARGEPGATTQDSSKATGTPAPARGNNHDPSTPQSIVEPKPPALPTTTHPAA